MLVALHARVVTHDCFWYSENKIGRVADMWTTNAAYARLILCATMVKDQFIQTLCVIHFSMTKLQEINGDQQMK
jgi:hypothetical protein